MHKKFRQDAVNCRIPRQPAAKTLPRLTWNSELAQSAYRLSSTCRFGFQKPTNSRFRRVGQNIAAYRNVEDAMNGWFGEHKDYNFGSHTCSQRCGNYLQIVSNMTREIGCAVTECPYSKEFPWGLFIVCNYGEEANFQERPYEAKYPFKLCSGGSVTVTPPTDRGWHLTKGVMQFNTKNCYCYK
ncbi:unnamed protein product [Heterobilharzia americana]|nr:unnamed protein product [Heterobilharzia americana]